MATRRRFKTGGSSSRSSVRLRSKGGDDVPSEEPSAAVMSLDVLAQVASETLENEPNSPQKIVPQKLSLRTIHSLEVLTLEQILGLKDQLLISLFTDVEANEVKKTYAYTCYLMPQQCNRQFTSFGGEMRAKADMKKHLYQHLEELKREALAQGKQAKVKFTAETVHSRKRRLYAEYMNPPDPPPPKKKKNRTYKPSDAGASSRRKWEVDHENIEQYMMQDGLEQHVEQHVDTGDIILDQVKVKDEVIEDHCEETGTTTTMVVTNRKQTIPVVHKLDTSSINDKAVELDFEADKTLKEEAEKHIEENEQFIIDLLSKTQPHHDHCYTTIFGSRKGSDVIHHIIDDSDEENEEMKATNNTVIYLDKKGNKARPHVKPILFLRHRSPNENVPMVSKEEVISEQGMDSDADDEDLNRLRQTGPYMSNWMPWQKKDGSKLPSSGVPKTFYRVALPDSLCTPFALKGKKTVIRVPLNDEDIEKTGKGIYERKKTVEKEVKEAAKKKEQKQPKAPEPPTSPENRIKEDMYLAMLTKEEQEGKLGWESKLALKFIRELKGKKKNENIPLNCKICKNKRFTATATLMYHYRSHAGIKPFVCLICKTTFTRQHSLNYHMLIHNNQSRFTCKDCGRKFRHPSHFKEHQRRHTGETPFVCGDCDQKFKTRNTYKRHLKTRHGKLLTAQGISNMSREEFMKVRTKPYKIPRLADIGYSMPELHFSRLKKSMLGRRQKQHTDSEDVINVDDILKAVDEIKEEIESDSDTESAEESLNNSGAHEMAEKLLSAHSELSQNSKTFKILETVCADVLTGNGGQSDLPEMQFQEITPKIKKPREKISIEIVEGAENLDGKGTVSITVPGETVLSGNSDSSAVQLEDLHIDIPVKTPIKTPIKVPIQT